MNDEARRGRQIVLVVIAGLLVPSVVLPLISGTSLRPQVVRLGIAVVMSFLMWRGYSWARSYLAFSLGVAALVTVLTGLLAALIVWWGALLLLLPPLYAWGAWALWSSPHVEAYIAYREKQRNPDMSFTTSSE